MLLSFFLRKLNTVLVFFSYLAMTFSISKLALLLTDGHLSPSSLGSMPVMLKKGQKKTLQGKNPIDWKFIPLFSLHCPVVLVIATVV